MNILLASSGEWFKVVGVVLGLFAGAIILVTIYSNITKKGNIKDKDGCGWPIFLVIVAIIIGILLNLKKCQCEGNKKDPYDPSEEYWENTPRHT